MKRLRFNFRSKKAVLATVAAVVALGLGGFGYKQVLATEVRDCSGNSIIKCGELSPSSFISQVKKNYDNNGHHDLQAIYANFGLVPSDYQKFVSYAEMGTDYRNGNVVVNGQTVATNAWSIGRYASWQGSGYFTKKIAGKDYYGNYNDKAYGSNVNSIPVMVLFDSKGVMQFAVMTACGNPVGGKKVTPSYSCDLLQKTHVSGNTYKFSTQARASSNASVVKAVYDFGDGSAKVTETSLSKQVQHTYTKSGTFTATVTVYVSLPGKQTVTVTSAKCQTKITVTPPPPPQVSLTCNQLTVTPGTVDQTTGDQQYTLAAAASAKNAAITGYTFTFGDNSQPQTIATSSTAALTTHTYAPGSYNLSVTVAAAANGKNYTATSVNCQKSITVKPPVPSTLACDQLKLTPGTVESDGSTEYTLAASASEQNATITGYTFTFGDNSQPQVVTSSQTTTSVTHTYAPSNSVYDAKVSVSGIVKGQHVTVSSPTCAGTITVKYPPIALTCDQLTLTPGTVDQTTGDQQYTLAASASAKNATITGYAFNFGDNRNQTVTTSGTTASTTHTYAPGTYSPSVTVEATANGKNYTATSNNCKKNITVNQPVVAYTCDSLTASPLGNVDAQGNQEYKLVANASVTNATITNYVFNLDDNNQQQTVVTGDTTASTTYTYAPGTYNPSVTVTVTLNDGTTKQVSSPACATTFKVSAPTCTAPNGQTYPAGSSECQPQTCTSPTTGKTYPAGSSECTPTCTSPTNGQTYPMGSSQCLAKPTSLVNTGPGSIAGLFAGATAIGMIGYRLYIGRRLSRNNL